jgi:Putative transposase/Transposase zinc-binding domain
MRVSVRASTTSLQTIFCQHFAHYTRGRRLHVRELRAATAIMRCRTVALGGRVLVCEQGHHISTQFNACRHRSCPRCADGPRQRWTQWQLQRLLPCEHIHAVFTLPHAFIALWEHNRAWLNAQLFDCVRRSVLALCADTRHLGAVPGIVMTLHSWGRDLARHPHVHCLISAGGLDMHGQWRASRSNYLVPVKALSALFRGKLLHTISEALRRQRLRLPAHLPLAHWRAQIRSQYRKHWNVHLGARYAHGRGVALYLARYVKGGPLAQAHHKQSRRLRLRGDDVELSYTDHRDGRAKRKRWSAQHFIERVLWHAAPRGQHLVRHCGLYATAARRHHLRALQQLCPQPMPVVPPTLAAMPSTPATCPRCVRPLVPLLSVLPAHRVGEFSKALSCSTTEPLGPTWRSSGHPPAPSPLTLRQRSLRRRMPLN